MKSVFPHVSRFLPGLACVAYLSLTVFTSGCAMVNGLLNTTLQLLQIGIQLAPMLLLVSVTDGPEGQTVAVEIPAEAIAGHWPSFETEIETEGHQVRLSAVQPVSQGVSAMVEIARHDRPAWHGRVAFPLHGGLVTNLTRSVRIAISASSKPSQSQTLDRACSI